MIKYPRIFLAIDNCFAYKRWTKPVEWISVIKDLGVDYIEASADTELDPLYMGEKYLAKWVKDVEKAQSAAGVKVANLYSGHGTYTTLGIAHTDMDVRKRFINKWFKPMMKAAADLDAGFGFLVHGFPDFVLQDRELYRKNIEQLYQNLSFLNEYAGKTGCRYLSLEQMYTPGMVPWTIRGTHEMIREVSNRSGNDFYFTEDVGHHNKKFLRPDRECIISMLKEKKKTGIWLGTTKAFELYFKALIQEKIDDFMIDDIMLEIEENPHMFSEKQDSDCYEWMADIGCFAPIIHLQQTDGNASRHLPFTDAHNQKGIVDGARVFHALKQSYDRQQIGTIQKSGDIFMTLELFAEPSAYSHDFLTDYAESVAYWRRFIPEDGVTLDQIAATYEKE